MTDGGPRGRGRRAPAPTTCRSTSPTSSSASMRAAFDAMGAQPPGLRLTLHQRDPARAAASARRRPRSSAGSRWPGRWSPAARCCSTTTALFGLAAEIEGHPDNVAPAFYGGFVISGRDDGGDFYAVRGRRRPADQRRRASSRRTRSRPSSRAGCCPPRCRTPTPPPTPAGRRCSSPRSRGQPEHLLPGHPRLPAPGLPRARRCRSRSPWSTALRADGVPAVVSGAGPTVLAFTDGPSAPATADLLARCPDGLDRARTSTIDPRRRPRRLTGRPGAPLPHCATGC